MRQRRLPETREQVEAVAPAPRVPGAGLRPVPDRVSIALGPVPDSLGTGPDRLGAALRLGPDRVGTGPGPGPGPDRARSGPRHRRCLDDLWMEEEKWYKRKRARAARGSLGQLDHVLTPQGQDRVRPPDDDEDTQLRPSTENNALLWRPSPNSSSLSFFFFSVLFCLRLRLCSPSPVASPLGLTVGVSVVATDTGLGL